MTPFVTHELIQGAWVPVKTPIAPERHNFCIVCRYGDWSGFRTLIQCLDQIPSWQGKPDGFYWIEMR